MRHAQLTCWGQKAVPRCYMSCFLCLVFNSSLKEAVNILPLADHNALPVFTMIDEKGIFFLCKVFTWFAHKFDPVLFNYNLFLPIHKLYAVHNKTPSHKSCLLNIVLFTFSKSPRRMKSLNLKNRYVKCMPPHGALSYHSEFVFQVCIPTYVCVSI